MGYLRKICVGAAAVVSSALLGYFLYKNYFQSKEDIDEGEDDSFKTESNSAEINETQSMISAEDVNEAENGNSTKVVNEAGASNTSQCSTQHQSKNKGKKPPSKSTTGYMGLRKGFLLK
ncbi:Hypothetical predicted protein [Paramuricea clavata]|uniref:Uncharacterized protein n=1 Tax=Paramuricea clavata TaxID=317549 RepID=A0A7D9DME0_PARCT|nr:Hypothetical predicted protein [Paramuricea clavata]